MSAIEKLIMDHIDIWTSAYNANSASRGRNLSNSGQIHGIDKLRILILDMAVRGRLLSQDPNDEPACELIKKVQIYDKENLKYKVNKEKLNEQSNPGLFDIPSSWVWAKLQDLSPLSIIDGDWIESKDQDPNGSIRLLQLADIGVGVFKDQSKKFINAATFDRLKCTELQNGDILIARLPNPIGRACIFSSHLQKSITVVDVAILRTFDLLCNEYIVNAINSKMFREQVESFGKGTTRFRISTGNLKNLLLPIPPLAEQKRIVDKVNSLMSLCDKMEQQKLNVIETHEKLVSSFLDILTKSKDHKEFNAIWQQILQHFDILFTTESSIEALKQTILQLAVMGKLVLPTSDWKTVKFGDIYTLEYGSNLPSQKRTNTGEYPVYGSNGIVGTHNIASVTSPCIVIGRKGSAGALNLCFEKGCCVTDVAYYCIPPKQVDLFFSFRLFQALDLNGMGKGIKPGLNRNEVYQLSIRIPPLEEQKRIVSKVNELLSICDILQKHVNEATQVQVKFSDAIISQAIKA